MQVKENPGIQGPSGFRNTESRAHQGPGDLEMLRIVQAKVQRAQRFRDQAIQAVPGQSV